MQMTYKIISGQYELDTEDQQAGYKMLFGEDNIQYKFDLYFHWYNIVHELGHCVVDAQKINMSKVKEEMFVNEFAVAYWKYIGAESQIKELAEIMGISHQNVKQILLKLEKKGFVRISVDEQDKRKQRIELTLYCQEFCEKNDEMSMALLKRMFEGVSEEQLQTTIQTIVQIEDNLKLI